MKTRLLIIIGIVLTAVGFSINQILLDTLPPRYPRQLFASTQVLITITAIIGLSGIPVAMMGIVFGWRQKRK